VNEQERQEISELILRALSMEREVCRISRAPGTTWYAVLTAEKNSGDAQRELWEALYRVRIKD